MAPKAAAKSANAGVVVSLSVNCLEVIGLGLTAWVTGSTAIKAQTAANAAEVAVTVFLLIGVLSSVRGPDDTHPLGYGRDRFFWSLFAALGLFAGGGGLALGEAVQSLLHPTAVHSYLLAYLVLAATAALDASAMLVGLRPLGRRPPNVASPLGNTFDDLLTPLASPW
jgi:divalent metal cation (Fe/Co/Zn/Cd) transporter